MSSPSHTPVDLRGLPLPELGEALAALGVRPSHAGRVFGAVHRYGRPLADLDFLGDRQRGLLLDGACLAPAPVVDEVPSADGSSKLVFALADGKRVEGVLIPTRADRVTLCLSTQAGCAMG
ncbi:MAG: 23S rRNA (adenine(2503)-C(2))-methyltransferase RlmN, partial [Myxococcales bacterium]|nr:23S rRNA (adenine(2503)-C(2))-methyltransferase RlmN [Myxococcales bacterium]